MRFMSHPVSRCQQEIILDDSIGGLTDRAARSFNFDRFRGSKGGSFKPGDR
jgi:hypothetical protein